MDIDPNDIAHIISMPGKKHVCSHSSSTESSLAESLLNVFSQLEAKGASLTSVDGALLIVKINRAQLGHYWGQPFAELLNLLLSSIAPGATHSLGIYTDSICETSFHLRLVASERSVQYGAEKPKDSQNHLPQINLQMDIPNFLRTKCQGVDKK